MHVKQHRNSIARAQLVAQTNMELKSCPPLRHNMPYIQNPPGMSRRATSCRITPRNLSPWLRRERCITIHQPNPQARVLLCVCVVRAASVAFDAMTKETRSVEKGRKKELESREKKKQRKKKEKNTKTRRHTVVQEMKQDRTIIMASRERKKGCPECKARDSFSRSKQIRDAKKNRSWRCCGGTEHGQRRQTFRRQDTQRQADRLRDGVISTMVGAVS
jgi:DNA-directed RNA polymerase subunit M/transcription elongation factor TFIIS